MNFQNIIQDLEKLKNPRKAKVLAGFFKTGKGEYGEGDKFWGIVVPKQRAVAKKYFALDLSEIQKLLNSPVHEQRLVALLILVQKYEKALNNEEKSSLAGFYLKNTKNINNWDLVDLSAEKILGKYFWEKPSEKKIIYKLAKSKNLWERRIAILTTFQFIKNGKFFDTLKICEMLMRDNQDLIQKACGWMLREVGKRNSGELEKFLKKYKNQMPRTMLRYSIEKLPEKKRKYYLGK